MPKTGNRRGLPAAGQPMIYGLDAGGHSAPQNEQGDYVIAYALS